MCYLLREQHQTEVSAMEDKVKWLDLDLEKAKKFSNESMEQFQTKVGNFNLVFCTCISFLSFLFSQMKTDNWLIPKLFCCWILYVPVTQRQRNLK